MASWAANTFRRVLSLPPSPPESTDGSRCKFEPAEDSTLLDGNYTYGLLEEDFKALLAREYPSMSDATFLDHAASPPPPMSAINAFQAKLSKTLLCNPHSVSPSSSATSTIIDNTRTELISTLFCIPPAQHKSWSLIFTSGTTAGCKLIAESFDWGPEERHGVFRYTTEAHTSLVGIRGLALKGGASVYPMEPSQLSDWLNTPTAEGSSKQGNTLFAFPSHCNATGSRLNLTVCKDAKTQGVYVLLDAAAHLATSPLDLGNIPLAEAPDFVVGSLYKTFGYPTGLGFLLVKRSSAEVLLRRGYFGGGTIDGLTVSSPTESFPRGSTSSNHESLHARFEDGTVPFLSIVALSAAMDSQARLFGSLSKITAHATALARLCEIEMDSLVHENGMPVCRIHKAFKTLDPRYLDVPGPTIAFTLLRPDGSPVGHVELSRLCAINNIHIRTGGLCNTGVLASSLELTDDDIRANIAKGKACWDAEEFGGVDGKTPTGIARVSFGAASSLEDVKNWLEFLRRFWVVHSPALLEPLGEMQSGETENIVLQEVAIYPIKSCHAFRPPSPWPIQPHGLLHDREWFLVSPSTGRALSQKQHNKMCLIRPSIDLPSRQLVIRIGEVEVSLPLEGSPEDEDGMTREEAEVCVDSVSTYRYPPSHRINLLLTAFLQTPCALARLPLTSISRHAHFGTTENTAPVPILLSNESPFLMCSAGSVAQVNEWLDHQPSIPGGQQPEIVKPDCFRGNFLLSSQSGTSPLTPFIEDTIDLLTLTSPSPSSPNTRKQVFQFLAPCRRCQMVCIDQSTGIRTKEPYNILSRKRRNGRGRIEFGVHLMHRSDLSSVPFVVEEGCRVDVTFRGNHEGRSKWFYLTW